MKEKVGFTIWFLSTLLSVMSIPIAPHSLAPLVSLLLGVIVFVRTYSQTYRTGTLFPVSAGAYLLYSVVVFETARTHWLVSFATAPGFFIIIILIIAVFLGIAVFSQRDSLRSLWKLIFRHK